MNRFFLLFLLGLSIIACNSTTENTMVVSGNVKGLKKGTLYLQKVNDTVLVTVDSLKIDGDGHFNLSTELESPEIFYLYLDKSDNSEFNDRITFFGVPGNITINTAWNTFALNAKINGSNAQTKLEEFRKNSSRFNAEALRIAQTAQLPGIQGNEQAIDSLNKLLSKNNLRSYLYALNYSLNHKESYVAPYLALTEVPDVNVKYLDSIYNSLPDSISTSKYGKELKLHISKVKAANK
ncbi:DUF4369 domain-containing protein [Cellulophaga sp. 20_2_10]|uniref:DUF4369 domain-containing protein n=1 Tax=Cellulophaga sp. 20_2_10 TaxID=2942476 RepID=UPI00201B307A|nr:DUF4369 domain-containing protein [Cellulophaga sp. 20_2_10]MCL5247025.1 DUF4369 domain-containing protein [Cellulophaga sp. 20_2_10]